MAWRDNFNCPRYVSETDAPSPGQTGAAFHHTVFFTYFCTMDFKLVSDYAPMGDQPEAIAQLVGSIRHGSKHNTLLGVTGSGKTFTVANVIAQLNRPTLVLSHNKDARGAALRRVPANSSRRTPWSISSPTTTITSRRPTSPRRTPSSKKTFRSTPRSRNCACAP